MTAQPSPGSAVPPASSTQTPILIMGCDRLSMHHGALGIVRSAGRLGVPVFHIHAGGRPSLARSRYSAGDLRFPPSATAEQKLETLHDFSRRHGRAVLVPVDDTYAMFLDDHAAALSHSFLFPRQPSGLARALASKREMHRLCLEHGVPTPDAVYPENEEDVLRYGEQGPFPVVAKRIDSSLPCSPGAPPVSIIRSREELVAAFSSMRVPGASNVMLQEYIPGTAESIWMLNGYFDGQSDCLVAFTGQKLRQSPPHTGVTTLGVCRSNPTVEETTRRFMKAIGYRGILDTGYRWDARDGQYKLLDVNPRIGATFRLFVGVDGMDVLRALYLDLTGGAVPASAEQAGRQWIVEPLDLRSSISYVRMGELSPGSWLRSLRHVDETAWWARDDPAPFLAESMWLMGDQLRKRVHAQLRRSGSR